MRAIHHTYAPLRGTGVGLTDLIQLRHYGGLIREFAQRPATGDLAGARVTRLRGRGVDFAEVRAWQPGDDVRSIDWRVTARKGKPHTRIFREERERPALLYVDQGASVHFGSRVRLKSVAIAEIAALIGWAVLANNDRIGALVRGTQRVPLVFRPARSRRRLLRILDEIARCNGQLPAPEFTDSASALRELRRVHRPGSQVFVISDFRDLSETVVDELRNLARHSELVLVEVFDPLDAQLPPADLYGIRQGDNKMQIDAGDPTLRARFSDRFRQRRERLREFASSTRTGLVSLSTADNPIDALTRRALDVPAHPAAVTRNG